MEEKREKFYESIEESILAIKEYWDKEEEKAQYQMAEERGEKRGVEQGIKQGIETGKVLGTLENFKELGIDEEEIFSLIHRKYGLSKEEIQKLEKQVGKTKKL